MSPITIALFTTPAMDRFVLAALSGMRRVGIDLRAVVIVYLGPLNPAVAEVAAMSGASVVPLSDLSNAEPWPEPEAYSDYGTPVFNLFTRHRIEALRHLMVSRTRILVADLDIAWFRNPLPYLEARLDVFPWVSQTEGLDSFPCLCAGFYAFRDCFFSRHLLDAVADHSRRDGAAECEQVYLNAIVAAEPDLSRDIFPLPEVLFPNGMQIESVLRRTEDVPPGLLKRPDPFIYHANFTIGLANKVALMESVGAFAGIVDPAVKTRLGPEHGDIAPAGPFPV